MWKGQLLYSNNHLLQKKNNNNPIFPDIYRANLHNVIVVRKVNLVAHNSATISLERDCTLMVVYISAVGSYVYYFKNKPHQHSRTVTPLKSKSIKTLIGFWTPGKIVLSTYPFTKKYSLTFEIFFISKDDNISV